MKRFIPRFGINPILIKELRSRMRGPRAFITITLILLLTGGVMAGILQIILAASRYSNVLSPQIGQTMFAALAFLELFMVCAITPAVTAGAVSGEKEKQTYEMLMATPLSATRVLWGKLVSAMSYIFLLLFAAVPLASIVFIFGGVAPREMLKALLVLLVVAVTFGFLGLFMSALFGRTGRATVASYLTVLIITIGPMFLAGMVGVLRESEPPRWILAPSPISALSSALVPSLGNGANFGSFQLFYILSGLWNAGTAPISQTYIPRPLYHYSLPLYFGFSMLLFMLSTRLVQPTRRWKVRRKEALVTAGTLLAFIAFLTAAFLLTANHYEWALKGKTNLTPTLEPMNIAPPAIVAEKRAVVAVQQAPPFPVELTATPTPAAPATVPVVTNQPEVNIVLGLEEEVQIYSAVAQQLYEVDHTFGEKPPNFPYLYLLQTTNDSVGDPNLQKGDPVILEAKVQEGVGGLLGNLPAEIHWVPDKDAVPLDEKTGAVPGNGAIITFGNIHLKEDGTVLVSASLYFGNLGASGKTYILTQVDGKWKITGTTGVEWIS